MPTATYAPADQTRVTTLPSIPADGRDRLVRELCEYFGSRVNNETVVRYVRGAYAELSGSVAREALPEMAWILVRHRLNGLGHGRQRQ